MAAIPVTIVGTMTYTDVGVGGGPVVPPSGGAPQPPLGIWGGAPLPWPTPPIYYPPAGGGGGPPLVIWGGGPHPAPPIYNPPAGGSGGSGPPYHIWGGAPLPWPTPPIYYPPQQPQPPLGIWGGAPIPWPTPPIYYPPTLPEGQPPNQPPTEGDQGKWAYSPVYGWVWDPGASGGKPVPPSGEVPPASPEQPS